tara:strand:+ start:7 stop:687 length:681 start_codon:yes stop_codon:yes gene_type:complete
MKKIITLLALVLFASSAQAGQFGVGVTGNIAAIAAQGTEADKNGAADDSGRSATASNNAFVGSVFAEYSMDNGFTLGVNHIPGSADISAKKFTRVDVSQNAASGGAGSDDRTNTAQAEIENYMSVYAEIPLHAGMYVKGGYVEMDVNTLETSNLAGAGTYGNQTVDGLQWGLGYRSSFGSNGFYKVEGSHTEFDTLTINQSTTDKGNRITADLDVTQVTLALGYNF